MTASLVGSTTGSQSANSNTFTTSGISANAFGCIVLGVALPTGGVSINTVSDTNGNSYTRAFRATGPSVVGECWIAFNATASTQLKLTVTLTNAAQNWSVVVGSYIGINGDPGGLDNVGAPQAPTSNSNAVSVSCQATVENEAIIVHVFCPSAVTTSGLTTGYSDIPGSGTSFTIHQSYLFSGVKGTNSFVETLSSSLKFVAIGICEEDP